MIVRQGEPISNREESKLESKPDVCKMPSTVANATLKEFEEEFNRDGVSSSGSPSIVSSEPAFKSSSSRSSVPYGIDNEVLKYAYNIISDWERARVPKDIIQNRRDAFMVQADSGKVHSIRDVFDTFKVITEQEGK
jgi:hypothetical protein